MKLGKELKTMWVVVVYVDGIFRDTVCVSIEKEVAVGLAMEGTLNAKVMGAPVEFYVIETMTDHAFTNNNSESYMAVMVEPPVNPKND